MANYDGYVRINTKIDTKKATSSLLTMQNSMEKMDEEINKLQKKLVELGEKEIPTDEFRRIEKEIQSTSEKLDSAKKKMDRFLEMHPGDSGSSAFRNLQYNIAELENKLWDAKEAQEALIQSGNAFTSGTETEEYQKTAAAIEEKLKKLNVLNKRYEEYISKQMMANSEEKRFQGLTKKTGGLLKTLSNRFKGLLLSLLVFNQISSGFREMMDGIKQGLQNYAKYSSSYNASVSQLLGSLETLKNSLGAAFAPLVQMVIPVIDTFINSLIDATNWVAQFIAAITGKTTWTKATRQVKDYAKSLENASKSTIKALAGFDELNVLQDSSASGTGESADATGMFTTEKVAAGIYDALKKGAYGLGETLNENIKSSLECIDWENIQEKAREIAINIAQFINGALSDTDMSYGIGKSLAELFNTAVDFLLTFIEELDWTQVVESFIAFLKGIFENLDYGDIAVLIGLGFAGMEIAGIVTQFSTWITGTLGPALLATWNADLSAVFASGSMATIASTIVTGIAAALLAAFLGYNFGKWLYENDILGIGTWADNLTSYYADKIEECGGNVVLGILKGIADSAIGIGQWINEKLVQPFIEWFCELFGIHSPSKVMAELAGYLVEGMLNGLINMPFLVADVFKQVLLKGKELITSLKDNFNNIAKFVSGTFKEKWTNGWKTISNGTISIFKNMWSGIKSVINWLISGVESMANGVINGINWIIDGINSLLSINIPATKLTPEINLGGAVIPKLSNITMTKLATGGITTGRTIAEIGEEGKEAVLPLENNTDWMDKLAEKVNGRGDARYTFVAQLNGKTIFEETVRQDEMYAQTRGHSAFAD